MNIDAIKAMAKANRYKGDDIDNFSIAVYNLQQKANINANWLLAIFYAESEFRPFVVNSLGYKGLFQVGKAAVTDMISKGLDKSYSYATWESIPGAKQVDAYYYFLKASGTLGKITSPGDAYLQNLWPNAISKNLPLDKVLTNSKQARWLYPRDNKPGFSLLTRRGARIGFLRTYGKRFNLEDVAGDLNINNTKDDTKDDSNNSPTEQPKSKGDYISTDNYNYNDRGSKGNPIALTNFFGPTIKIDPISMDMSGFSEDEKGYFRKGLGLLPFVWYNSYQISYQDITYFTLYHDGLLPNIKMTFRDTLNIIKSDGYPLDDTKILIFLNSRSKSLKSIYMQFKITSFSDNGNNIYSLSGIVDVSSLYVKKYKAFQDKNSFDCLQEVAKDLGMGFNSNISSTNDKMTWISPGVSYYKFIDDVILNSYLSDDSFLIGYIDYFYNINYIDIESELRRDTSNDNMVDTSGIEQYTISDPTSKEEDRIIPLQLTTDSSLKNTNAFIKSYKIINDSTFISLEKGYSTKVKFYDYNKKDLLIFDVDSITSEGDKSIILKGAPADEKFFKENYNSIWTGKIDVDNVHTNYNYAIVQNRRNLDDLVKISCELTLGNPNFNFYKFQKVFISFINSTVTASSREIQLKRLTGYWIITDISYIYSNGVLKQVLSGIKRELSMSDDEIKSDSSNSDSSNKTNENNNQINTNPDPVGLTSSNIGVTQSSVGASQSAPNENTNTKSDDTIISNSYLLSETYFSAYYDGTKIKGGFGITSNGHQSLSKDLKARLYVSYNSTKLEVCSFTIGGINSKKPGYGEFLSIKDGWKEALSLLSDNKDRLVIFSIVIEGYDKYIFKFGRCVSPFDCPDLDIKMDDIISMEDWDDIVKNPCKTCYPNGYSSGSIILNGQACPMEGF